MKTWFDTEFLENGTTIQLISVGMVREDGAELYLETPTAKTLANSEPWLRANVRPHLRGGACVKTRDAIVVDVKEFVGPRPELWAYYADYDWVVLCQLFGRMIDLPEGWPMFCRDVQQWKSEFGEGLTLPAKPTAAHDALADARWARDAWVVLDGVRAKVLGMRSSGRN